MKDFSTPQAKLIHSIEGLIQHASNRADSLEKSRELSDGDRFVTRYSLQDAKMLRADLLKLHLHIENFNLIELGDLAWGWNVRESLLKDLRDCAHLLRDVINTTASRNKATHLKQTSAHKIVRAVRLGILMLEHQLRYYAAAHMAETLEIMEQTRHRSS